MRDALCASEPGIGLAIQMIVLCLVALSAWLVLRVGRISLGQQAYFGIGGYCTALIVMDAGGSYWTALAIAALVFWRHQGNISRLLAGTEPRIGAGK